MVVDYFVAVYVIFALCLFDVRRISKLALSRSILYIINFSSTFNLQISSYSHRLWPPLSEQNIPNNLHFYYLRESE